MINFGYNASSAWEYLKSPSQELQQIKLFIWSFVLPPICLVGIVTNVLNVIVFYSLRKSKNKLYLYFLVHSACDLLYLLICLVYFAFKTCLSESYSSYYWVVVYECVFFLYATTLIATFLVLIELLISLKRLFLILNFNLTFKLKRWTVIFACFAVTIFVHLPVPMALYIREVSNATARYEVAYERIRQRPFFRATISIPITFRGLVAPVILLVMTIVLSKKLGRQLNRKREMVGLALSARRANAANNNNNSSRTPTLQCSGEPLVPSLPTAPVSVPSNQDRIQNAKRNVTRMIISVNLLFIFSNFTVYVTSFFVINLGIRPRITDFSAIVSNLVLLVAHTSTIFVYYNFDSVFRRTFNARILISRRQRT